MPVLVLVTLVVVAAGLLAGLAPGLQASRPATLDALRGADGGQPRRHGRARSGFVVVQLALSLVLLVAAGLFGRSLRATLAVDPGMDAAGVVIANLNLAPHGYRGEAIDGLLGALRERLAARPEIAAAGLGTRTPLSGMYQSEGVLLPGEPENGRRLSVGYAMVDEGYLATVRMPLVAGRAFTTADREGGAPVAIVNETLARRLWPDSSPLGRTLPLRGGRTVVGVVRTDHYRTLTDSAEAMALVPLAQARSADVTVFLRGRGDGEAAVAALREELAALDPDVALTAVMPLAGQIGIWLLPQRVAAWFVGALGAVGLALAAIGVYGVLAFHVAQRTREFGVRLALGARAADVRRLVLRQGLRLTLVGTVAGLALAAAVGRLAARFLYGVGAADPLTFVAVPLVLAAVALVASWLPARRATRADPMAALRTD